MAGQRTIFVGDANTEQSLCGDARLASKALTRKYRGIFILMVSVVSGLALCSLATLVMLVWLVSGMCDITMIQRVRYSPSQERKLVVFERNCGATTGFTTHVSVLAAERELPNQQGNLFVMDGHPQWTQVTATWIDEDQVLIRYPTGPTVYKSNERFWRTKVTYEPRAK
ncbi:MAG: hypothetical protein DCC55_39880 [Chloroflexi bacterium]|nr:MAG: hypothetical protein DCC55_39880 [Chloroflexota bacterium]